MTVVLHKTHECDDCVTLEWSPSGGRPWGWLIESHHGTLKEAEQRWAEVKRSPTYDHDESHWRIVVWKYSPATFAASLKRRIA